MLENYKKHENGVIEQIVKEPFDYNFDYSNNYNKLGEIGTRMAYLRLGHLIGTLGFVPESIMDIGYGNGDFLNACKNIIPKCYASDVSVYPAPEGCEFIKDPNSIKVDVATFYDVLEHYNNIYDIKDLQAKYVVVSLPHCHNFSDEWFENWKHRKPNEHLWHFNAPALINFMSEVGYEVINITNLEDTIRKNNEDYTNILTGVFRKKV
jgi:hypothetical protein